MTSTAATSRAWTFDKKSVGPWPGSHEPQRDRYWAARDRPSCRNRGPSGRLFGSPGSWVRTYWIVKPDIVLEPGSVLPSGLVVPVTGAVLHNVPLARPCFSMGQARKLLRKVRERWADARVVESCGVPEERWTRGPSISAPGAAAGWWDVRAPDRAPRLTWKQFAAAVAS